METELFVHFAEIAGVFVGFGALISLRSTQPTDPHDVMYLRSVLGLGVWVVVCALVPIAVNRYGVHGHALWLSCASLALAIWAVFLVALSRSAESRSINSSPEWIDRMFPVVGLPLHVITAGSLLLAVLGLWRSADEALYVTALTGGVIFAGYTLLAYSLSGAHESHVVEADR
ncbi:MAG TPA: hypothetical protein VHO26_01180 [Propionibacteriaceae bacterium]|nr:hypothetical protein [Propionibacteriaceae bacterium]